MNESPIAASPWTLLTSTLASNAPLAVALAALLTTTLITGVILPAVWSRDAARRSAALAVLTRILEAFRPRTP
jgi:hypothetical protein